MESAEQLRIEGDVYLMSGRPDLAAISYLASRRQYILQGDDLGVATCLHSLGIALIHENHTPEGLQALREARSAWLNQNRPTEAGRAERSLGTAYLLSGHYLDAYSWLDKSRQTLAPSDATDEQGITEARLGRLYSLDGEYDAVDGCFELAFDLLSSSSPTEGACLAHTDRAYACLEMTRWDEMKFHLEHAWKLATTSSELFLRQVLRLTGKGTE